MLTFRVITVGESEGLILNEDAKRILKVRERNALYLTEAPNGAMRITPYNPAALQKTLPAFIIA